MAWYTTGTIAVSGTTVTGTGTNFLDNTQSIGPGQALLIPGSGTVKMYEVASVQSATKLTLKTSAGTVAAGQAYAILSFYTDSVPDFARRLAAQLSYYQSQMDGWQQIMTGTGSITMTAPDGTTVTISSFAKLTADIATAMTDKGNLANTIDLNTLGAAASWGVYTQTANANALATLNYPEQKAGTLLCTKAAYSGVIQTYIPFDSGAVYTRALSGNWNGTDGPWGVWKMVGASFRTQGSVDLNTFTGAQLFVGGTFTNGPSTMGNATAFIQCLANGTNSLTAQIAIYTTSGRMFTRTNVSGTWTAWAESLTTNSIVAIANGGTGAATAAAARSALALNYSNSAANPGGGVYRLFMTDDSGRMVITRRFNVTAKANSATAFSYSWSDDGAGTYVGYPGCSVMGESGNSANFKVGVEALTNAKVSGFIHNTGTTDLSVWLTFLVIGIKA